MQNFQQELTEPSFVDSDVTSDNFLLHERVELLQEQIVSLMLDHCDRVTVCQELETVCQELKEELTWLHLELLRFNRENQQLFNRVKILELALEVARSR